VGIDRALPSEEFFYGQLITAANFLQTDSAATHGIDYHRLAPGDQRLVLGGGKSVALWLVRAKISFSSNSYSSTLSSMAEE